MLMRIDFPKPDKSRQKAWINHTLESISVLYPNVGIYDCEDHPHVLSKDESEAFAIAEMFGGKVKWGVNFTGKSDSAGDFYQLRAKLHTFLEQQSNPNLEYVISRLHGNNLILYVNDKSMAMLTKLSFVR